MIIELIPFTAEHVIPEDGKYLMATETNHLKKKHYVCATCTKVWNEKKKSWITAVDVSNQIVLQISKSPLQ